MNNDVSSENPRFQPILNRAVVDDRVVAVSVFGSFTRNDSYNDIDICLFTRKGDSTVGMLFEYLGFSEEIFDIKLFSELPLYIQIEVLKEGQILLLKNYDAQMEVVLSTFKEWDLFKPHFECYLEAVRHG